MVIFHSYVKLPEGNCQVLARDCHGSNPELQVLLLRTDARAAPAATTGGALRKGMGIKKKLLLASKKLLLGSKKIITVCK